MSDTTPVPAEPIAPSLTLAGLGPAGLSLLSSEALQLLERAPRLILRTERHPGADELRARGVAFESLDHIYQGTRNFADLYPSLAEAVLTAARSGPVVYAVPGHPLLGEESVRILIQRCQAEGLTYRVLPAPGFTDVVAVALAGEGIAPDLAEWQVADGAALDRVWWDPSRPTLVFQVDDAAVASRVKLALLEEYPDEWEVWRVRSAGDPQRQSLRRVPLHQMDHMMDPGGGDYDHLTTLYLPPLPPEQRRHRVQSLVDVMARLRSPGGCPWDREQSYASLKRYVLEEAYEVLEAIDFGDPDLLCEELGDLLLQVVFLSQIATEEGYFDIRDVAGGITEKLVRRHPHVFGDLSVADSDEVLRNWDAIKREEKPERTSALDGVPRELPALMKALEISKRAVKVGFEWRSLEEVFEKLDEELGELKAELPGGDREKLSAELGDLLFTLVNVARWLRIDPEEALRQMVDRFGRRFREMERLAGGTLEGKSIDVLDPLWDQAKLNTG